ncbi:hypothetical protein A1O7_03282 [Cladophialophora yegresii CBS 114405]|uniref:Glucose 1-dehydrogenase n=1 Tax=Cladophialophora yegresii CBS 114405 TaxID=1182544 RepID=W9WE73_9EURO|nr:uncharacterized protein A1O7_03282 [Cladophialophora yegresii CBS 114405]EXJ62841.1 hypothetical protein A1O7_03282 [Cladophialophora yegresii CBS 114405]
MTSPSTPSAGTPPPPPARPLHGRIAVVTGSSSPVGAAVALALAAQGCSLFCIDVAPTGPRQGQNHGQSIGTSNTTRDRQPGTHERIRHMGGEATYHKADTTRARDMDLAIRACVAKYHRVDILVTNASASASASASAYAASTSSPPARPLRCHETTDEDFDRALAVHARAPFLACKYAVRQMLDGQPRRYGRARGWIVNVASPSLQGVVATGSVGVGTGMGMSPHMGSPGSCAGQAAAVMLTRQIALDYATDAIHCNALCPGFVDAGSGTSTGAGIGSGTPTGNAHAHAHARRSQTSFQSQPHEDRAAMEAEDTDYTDGSRPSEPKLGPSPPFGGRLGTVEDVARAAVFLCGDDAAWITGVTLPVDGGGYLLR